MLSHRGCLSRLLRRNGTALPEGSVIVYVNPSIGATLQANADNTFSLRTQFSTQLVLVPLQLLVRSPRVCALLRVLFSRR